jgi:hypothetical protein
LKLFAVVDRLIGAAWAAEFGGVHIEEALDHFVAVESGEEEESGFAGADYEFSGAVGHSSVLAVLESWVGRNRKGSMGDGSD